MTERRTTVPPDGRRATPGSKRKFCEVYDPTNEQFPKDSWHVLNHEIVIDLVRELCDELTIPLEQYAPLDQAITNLVEKAATAKKLPEMKKLRVAILGEQGAGKSTLVNALLDRRILDASASSSACTAFATTIEYKEGAADDTKVSDVKIEFLSKEELRPFVKDQVNRYAEYHYPVQDDEEEEYEQDNDTEEEEANDSDGSSFSQSGSKRQTSGSHPRTSRRLRASAKTEHEEGNDSDGSSFSQTYRKRRTSGPRPQGSRRMKKAAKTAKDFFGIVFNIKEDLRKKEWLENVLETTDIREGNFERQCLEHAESRMDDIANKLRAHDGVSVKSNVSDKNLTQARNQAKKIWPFVKGVTISTGHVLLRYGICFLDLPGYGDTSQLRNAVINKYRAICDDEIVVAPHMRFGTSTTHESYLQRSLNKGTHKMMLVMTKSDDLFNEDDYRDYISQIPEEPFISLTSRLDEMIRILEETPEEASFDDLDDIMREGALATILYETELISEIMQDKSMTIFSTAPQVYMTWKNPLRSGDPFISPEVCGIPALRQHLFSLPAATNFQRYRAHVFNELPKLRHRADHVQEKHVEDEGYAEMRRELERQTPALKSLLETIAENQIDQIVAAPWSQNKDKKISDRIESLISRSWKHPLILYAGFAKMLRENGIPMNGKYCGRNLNEELLGTMAKYIDKWKDTMAARIEPLVKCLLKPVQDLLHAMRLHIERSGAAEALKDRATEALEETSEAVEEAGSTFLENLQDKLNDNHVRYTSEIDVLCPVAKEMQPRYERAQDERFVLPGRGSYQRKRQVLQDAILSPSRHNSRLSAEDRVAHLVKNLKEQIMKSLKELWGAESAKFIVDVDNALKEFSRIASELLLDAAFMTEEHRKARELLDKLLQDFDENLEQIQNMFIDAENEESKKKVKVEEQEPEDGPDAGDATVATESESMQLVPFASQEDSVPIMRNLSWDHFRATFGMLGP